MWSVDCIHGILAFLGPVDVMAFAATCTSLRSRVKQLHSRHLGIPVTINDDRCDSWTPFFRNVVLPSFYVVCDAEVARHIPSNVWLQTHTDVPCDIFDRLHRVDFYKNRIESITGLGHVQHFVFHGCTFLVPDLLSLENAKTLLIDFDCECVIKPMLVPCVRDMQADLSVITLQPRRINQAYEHKIHSLLYNGTTILDQELQPVHHFEPFKIYRNKYNNVLFDPTPVACWHLRITCKLPETTLYAVVHAKGKLVISIGDTRAWTSNRLDEICCTHLSIVGAHDYNGAYIHLTEAPNLQCLSCYGIYLIATSTRPESMTYWNSLVLRDSHVIIHDEMMACLIHLEIQITDLYDFHVWPITAYEYGLQTLVIQTQSHRVVFVDPLRPDTLILRFQCQLIDSDTTLIRMGGHRNKVFESVSNSSVNRLYDWTRYRTHPSYRIETR